MYGHHGLFNVPKIDMGWFHLFYYATTAIVLAVPVWHYLKHRDLASLGVLFPFFYFIYSFIAPIAIIIPAKLSAVSSSYHVWGKLSFTFKDRPYFYLAHTYFLAFYLIWTGAYLWAVRKYRSHKTMGYKGAIAWSAGRMPTAKTFFMLAVALGCTLTYLLFTQFGPTLEKGISIYKAKITRLAEYQIDTTWKGGYSLWGSLLLCYAAVVMVRLKQIESRRSLSLIAPLVLLYLWYIAIAVFVGDRNQLFIPLIGAFVVYNIVVKRTRLSWKFTVWFILAVFLHSFIGTFRKVHPEEFGRAFSTHAITLKYLVSSTIFSVESFAAYASLPIMIMAKVPILYGASILYLALAFLPRIIAPFRPLFSYSYMEYSKYAGIWGSKQGFTMHYVADWYLNFSIAGVIIGGFITGYLMGLLECKSKKDLSIFWIVAFASLCGSIPTHLRGPIEGLRAIPYEYWSVPFIFFVLYPRLKEISSP